MQIDNMLILQRREKEVGVHREKAKVGGGRPETHATEYSAGTSSSI